MTLSSSYKAGSITVAAGGTQVVGTGTNWTGFGVRAGDILWAGGIDVAVASVESATALTLAFPWGGPALSGSAYEIRLTPDATRVLTASREAIATFEGFRGDTWVNANIYPSVTAGLAATVNGQQFQVISGDWVIRYRRDSATLSTEMARFPTASKVSQEAARAETAASNALASATQAATAVLDETQARIAGDAAEAQARATALAGKIDRAGAVISVATQAAYDVAINSALPPLVVLWASGGKMWMAGSELAVQVTSAAISPSATSAPSFDLAHPEGGQTITISPGTYAGTTPIAVQGVLTLAGVDVSAQMVGQKYTIPAGTAVGTELVWTETPSNVAGLGPAQSVTVATVASLSSLAQVYRDFVAAYPGTDQSVTSLPLGGTLGLTATEVTAGGDAPAIWQADGLHLTGLDMMRITTMAGGSVDGTLILLDWTPAAPSTGTNDVVLLKTASTNVQLFSIATGAFSSGGATNVIFNSDRGPGVRGVYGGYRDRRAGTATQIAKDGYVGADALEASTGAAFDWTRLELFKGAGGVVHRMLIMTRKVGENWPADPQTVIDRFAGRVRPAMSSGWAIQQDDGQSLALGPNPSSALQRAVDGLNRNAVKRLDGLKSPGGTGVAIHGGLAAGLDPAIPATRLVPATVSTVVPLGLLVCQALVLHRARRGLPNPRLIFGFNGMGGQPVENFDNDQPSVTGSIGTVLFDATRHWLSEAKRLAPAAVYAAQGWCQGEANINDAAGSYLAKATETFADKDAQAQTIFGTVPTRYLWQTSSYVNSTNKQPAAVRLEQVEIARRAGHVMVGPLYPYLVADNNVHPDLQRTAMMAEIRALAQIAAETGDPWPILYPTLTLGAGTFELTWPVPMADDGAHYAAYGGAPAHFGLAAVGGGAITSAVISEDGMRVTGTTTGAVTGIEGGMQVADRSGTVDASGQNYSASRLTLRQRDWSVDSLLLPALGEVAAPLRRWALAFRVAV